MSPNFWSNVTSNRQPPVCPIHIHFIPNQAPHRWYFFTIGYLIFRFNGSLHVPLTAPLIQVPFFCKLTNIASPTSFQIVHCSIHYDSVLRSSISLDHNNPIPFSTFPLCHCMAYRTPTSFLLSPCVDLPSCWIHLHFITNSPRPSCPFYLSSLTVCVSIRPPHIYARSFLTAASTPRLTRAVETIFLSSCTLLATAPKPVDSYYPPTSLRTLSRLFSSVSWRLLSLTSWDSARLFFRSFVRRSI